MLSPLGVLRRGDGGLSVPRVDRSVSCSPTLAAGVRHFVLSCIVLITVSIAGGEMPTGPARPNILWITVEDMSPHLGSYGDSVARTPRLEAFAGDSVRYTRAFATAPVCSPARSCLITGLYASSLGTQRLRSEFPIPSDVRGFPERLREAGYFTTNNVKTDYNVANERAFIDRNWDRNGPSAHWRQRTGDETFFSVFNLMTTHQSRTGVWPEERFEREVASELSPTERCDPNDVPVPPFYPDVPIVRRALARYYDCIAVMDRQVGRILDDLASDGLEDDTIVFFFSDHGMGIPRGKRVLHDSGMHVPLMVRCPERFRSLVPGAPGSTSDRLVSFVDFAPTVLSVLGLEVPPVLQGVPFLGPAADGRRSFVYGARDRVDEVFELSRSVRDERFLYIRNYRPHLSWMPPERYSDGAAMRREIARLRDAKALGRGPMTYAASGKAIEELYDVRNDPHQLHNLANDPGYRRERVRLRGALRAWILDARDLGFITEPDAWERAKDDTPFEMARDRERYPLERILRAAELVGRVGVDEELVTLLGDADPGVRYQAAVGLHAAERLRGPRPGDPETSTALELALEDPAVSVRIEAAAALAARGKTERALAALASELEHERPEATLHAMRTLELLGSEARPVRPAVLRVLERAEKGEAAGEHPCWMFVRFSAEALCEADP